MTIRVVFAEDLPSLLDLVETAKPDVVVTDIRMPPSGTDEGIRAAASLREDHPDVGVVVLSQYASPSYALDLLSGGSEGRAYLLKERVSDVDELVDAIRQVADGGSVIDPKVVEELVSATATRPKSDLDRLTPRETEILHEMATGKSNAAIAETLILSERAVEKHTNSIFSKLGLSEERNVNRRVKAVLLYLSGQGS
jgi:DNA-binding NarL/FixJ family response regulator